MTRAPLPYDTREVAHDIGNLLTALIGAADSILERTGIDPETQADASQIREAARRGSGLLRRFHDCGSWELDLIRINATIRSISRLLAHSLGGSIMLRLALDEPDVSVRIDASQLDRMLLNLVINAGHAMPDGGTVVLSTTCRSVKVEVHRIPASIPSGDYAVIAVTDNGAGIAEELLRDIFEPGITSRPNAGGSGIGLASVRDTAGQCGGFVSVESIEGQGTRFEIWLPCTNDVAPALIEVQSVTAPGTVLLVEDDPLVRQIAERVLRRSGWTVLCAESAEDALETLEDIRCDLLISDVALPGMDGIALARQTRMLRADLPIVLTSGYEPSTTDVGFEVGDFVFLTKPYAQQDLMLAVSRAAGSSKDPTRQKFAGAQED
jgi:two-component system cell cycle sensor histidine kinase/response regulator CckA